MSIQRLTETELADLLSELPGWALREDGKAIVRTFRFADFNEAWGFMNRVALLAEAQDHHPEWSNVYGRVDVTLSTHTAGGVTEKDVALAKKMEMLANS